MLINEKLDRVEAKACLGLRFCQDQADGGGGHSNIFRLPSRVASTGNAWLENYSAAS